MSTSLKEPIVNGAALPRIQDLITVNQVNEHIDRIQSCLTPDRSCTAQIAGVMALLALGRRQNEIIAGARAQGHQTHVAVNAVGVAVMHVM